jgi:hypothetical protein
VRLLGFALVFSVIAVGTVALAEPAGVIDPWGRASGGDSWFGSSRDEPSRDDSSRERVIQAELKDPWAPASEAPPTVVSDGRIDVFPVERATLPSAQSSANGIVNPWAPPVIAREMPSLAAAPANGAIPHARTPWSDTFVEIVDPWKRMPEWAAADRVRLVIDPWAR